MSGGAIKARAIVYRTHGSTSGPTRLVSPGELGELLKPFVFLDLFNSQFEGAQNAFGMHPHSGIATLTYLIEGDTLYEDTTGEQGVLLAGGVEWMRAGSGVWHTGGPAPGVTRVHGFQLWIALPPAEENAPAQSLYFAPSQIPQEGPAPCTERETGAVLKFSEHTTGSDRGTRRRRTPGSGCDRGLKSTPQPRSSQPLHKI